MTTINAVLVAELERLKAAVQPTAEYVEDLTRHAALGDAGDCAAQRGRSLAETIQRGIFFVGATAWRGVDRRRYHTRTAQPVRNDNRRSAGIAGIAAQRRANRR